MATLNETIEQVQNVFNDIEGALQEQGVDTSNLKPIDYANAVRGIVNDVTVENLNFLPVIIFKYTKANATKPIKPSGGRWENINGESYITPPDGWYLDLNDVEDASVSSDIIWMSVGIFKNDGTMYSSWTNPVRISGKNGKDGEPGKQGPAGALVGVVYTIYTPIYCVTDANEAKPDTPSCSFDSINGFVINTEGWQQNQPEMTGKQICWQSTAAYQSNGSGSVVCSDPIRISSADSDYVKSVIKYYKKTDSENIPSITEDGWIPNPTTVPLPDIVNQFLWSYEVTQFAIGDNQETQPYLVARYQLGLTGIEMDYTCNPSLDIVKQETYEAWFKDSDEAIKPNEYYEGLNEETMFLWCRERFIFSNKEPSDFYRIISTYTAAEKAAIIYSAGVYNPRTKYERTDEQRPYIYYPEGYVIDGKEYYYFVLKKSYDDELNYELDTYNFEEAYGKEYWEKMESFEAIYSDIGVLKSALVGKFVFDYKYLFSQKGIDNTKNPAEKEVDYTRFVTYGTNNGDKSPDESEVGRSGIALAIEVGAFVPNVLIDALTGNVTFGHGASYFDETGKGYLANGHITWDSDGNVKIGSEDQYVSFKNGELEVTGSINIGSKSSGLTNFSEWQSEKNEIGSEIESAKTSVQNLSVKISQLKSKYDEAILEQNTTIENFINEISKDGFFTKSELTWLKSEKQNVSQDYIDLKNQLKIYYDKDDFLEEDTVKMSYEKYYNIVEKSIADLEVSEHSIEIPEDFLKYQKEWYESRVTKLHEFTDDTYREIVDVNNLIKGVDSDTILTGLEKQSIKKSLLEISSLAKNYNSIGSEPGIGSYHSHYNMTEDIELRESLYNSVYDLFKYCDNTLCVWESDNTELENNFREVLNEYLVNYHISEYNIEKSINSTDYLKGVFSQGSTNINGGVVLSECVAVCDQKKTPDTTDDEVIAILNGSDDFVDDDGHTIILAGGIDWDSHSSNKEAIKNASTTICSDGKIKSNKIELKDGCKIGDDVEVSDGGIRLKSDSITLNISNKPVNSEINDNIKISGSIGSTREDISSYYSLDNLEDGVTYEIIGFRINYSGAYYDIEEDFDAEMHLSMYANSYESETEQDFLFWDGYSTFAGVYNGSFSINTYTPAANKYKHVFGNKLYICVQSEGNDSYSYYDHHLSFEIVFAKVDPVTNLGNDGLAVKSTTSRYTILKNTGDFEISCNNYGFKISEEGIFFKTSNDGWKKFTP